MCRSSWPGSPAPFFVVTANAWMQQPTGSCLENVRVIAVDSWAAMFNPATPPQTEHMIIAALVVAGFLTASVDAVAMLRGRLTGVPLHLGGIAMDGELRYAIEIPYGLSPLAHRRGSSDEICPGPSPRSAAPATCDARALARGPTSAPSGPLRVMDLGHGQAAR